MQIAADALLTPDREIRPGTLVIDSDRILRPGGAVEGASHTGTLLPGFIDLQCNGAAGVSLAEATEAAFAHVGRALLASGTTAYCPTLPSAPRDRYPRFLDAAAAARRHAPRILGVHLEGPFLSPARAGAHDPRNLRAPDPDWLEGLLARHPDLVRIVTLAPELPGALEVVSLCVERGVTVAVGHSDATAEEAEEAFDAGAVLLTHVFNAMRPLHHRDPGIVGAALAHPRARCSLIADGAHVDRRLAGLVATALGPHRTVLVSDAVASPTEQPLSGGFALLDGAVANMRRWGVSLPNAVRMATATPADVLGLPELGRLDGGCLADVVLWHDDRVAGVWTAGEAV